MKKSERAENPFCEAKVKGEGYRVQGLVRGKNNLSMLIV